MDKKEGVLLGLFIIGLAVVLSTVVLAAHYVAPATGNGAVGTLTGVYNYSVKEDRTFFLNLSVNNTDLGATNITQVNVTIPSSFSTANNTNGSSLSNPTVIFSMTSTVLTWTNNSLGGLLNGSGGFGTVGNFWLNVTGATPGIYNISVQTQFNTSLNRNSNLTIRVNDTTLPNVESSNITMAPYNNNSGTIILNVSVGDNSLINTVFFNITNATGDIYRINATNPTGVYWNATFLTTAIGDGKYNLTIYANDTYGDLGNYTTLLAGNINDSAKIQITIDNTDPSGSASCSPSSVERDDTTTCTCSGTDSLSGVNSTSITANPSTAQTGTFTTSCTITDLAGNTGTVNAEYTVTGSGGGASSSGGGSGLSPSTTWTATFTVTDADFSSGTTRDVAEKKRLQVNIDGESHFVGVIDVTPANAKISVSSTPQEVTMNVGETRKFEVTDDNFYDMQVTLVSVSGSTASIKVQSIHEEMPEAEATTTTTSTSETGAGAGATSSGMSRGMIAGIVIAILIIAIVAFFIIRRK